jgi:creatinine amidohydrolase
MRYELMRPPQLRQAIAERWPVVLPLGVLEYHGDHLPVGMDTLAVIKVLELLEQERPLVILPAFHYGAASFVVEPPEGKGTVHVDADHLQPLARDLFRSLLRIGFRNIHFFIHHQSENFTAGMPTDLAALDPAAWYTRSAAEATQAQGAKGVALILQAMREVLR